MINSQETNKWIRHRNNNLQARMRLFCFPYAGGSALSFRTWADNLPHFIEVFPIEMPGRGVRLSEPPFHQISPLVEEISYAIHPYLDIPFAFFGHSLGALISFELARFVRKTYALNPVHLFVSGRGAPQVIEHNKIHHLSDAEFLEALRRFNGTPKKVLESAELMQLLLPTLRADLMINESYTYTVEPPLDCPITVFGGLQDPLVNRDDMEAWKEHTLSSFSLHLLPGDHFFINTAQYFLLQLINKTVTAGVK